MKKSVSFNLGPGELAKVRAIAAKAKTLDSTLDEREVVMNITACHSNGCPLDLDLLLAADEFSFGHDIYGIADHLDKDTGELTRGFLPRFTQR